MKTWRLISAVLAVLVVAAILWLVMKLTIEAMREQEASGLAETAGHGKEGK